MRKAAYNSGIRESARRARAVAQQAFAYAKDTYRATQNPARELAGSSVLKRPAVTPFAALKSGDVGKLLAKIEATGLEPTTAAALRLMLYAGVRDSALRGAKWGEFDLEAGTRTIPAERMKSGREFRTQLPLQAVAMLTQLRKRTGRARGAGYVFASHAKADYLAENTLRLALHGLGVKVTAHGFRSLLTDVLSE